MPAEITMPQLSDTMSEGTLVKWLKKEGDKVKENAADIKRQYSGGAAASPGSAAPATKAIATEQSAAAGSANSGGVVATVEAENTAELHEPDNTGHGATREPPSAVPPVPNHGQGNGNRMIASPLARRIAADKGIDLSLLKGTGPGGRIIQRDVTEARADAPSKVPTDQKLPVVGKSASTAGPPAPQRISRGEKQVIPLTKMRQAIAKGLQASKQNVPHFYVSMDVDVEELSELRVRLNQQLETEKVRLSIGDLISKAVAVALLRHPAVNGHYNADKSEITRFGDVHLGFAVALPEGLIVPVLRNIDQMGLKEIRQRSADLIDRARAQRLKQDEMTGSTFTISNLGTYGVSEFAAIINPPSVGILAVGAAEKRPVVHNGQITARTMLKLTLSADHRAVDGAVGADFLRTVKNLLEEPGLMLI
jgi:pyruvate dehydrogenase E2 component (dihydrolipoamide acetyltransferase)